LKLFLSNTDDRYGLVAILLHWFLAAGFLGLFALGWYMVELSYYDPLYNRLPAIHKSIGVLMLCLLAFHILWLWWQVRPEPDETLGRWERVAARAMHELLLLGTLLIMITGYLIPTSDGSGIQVFGWFEAPAMVSVIENQEDRAGLLHKYLSYALLALAALHAAAALQHHFFNRDQTLRRMLGLKPRR